ncbi:MAG: hypothetical protein ACLSHG_02745 [Oscillospiraceae bacterium]
MADYAAGKFEVLTLEHYIDLLEQCLCVLPPECSYPPPDRRRRQA